MAYLNQVNLIGRLTRDPEQRSTANGTYIAKFGLAMSKKYRQDGIEKDEVTFVDVVCFGKLAEIVCDYTKKGRQVYVGGRLKFDTWQDKNTGLNRSKINIIAETVQFIDSGKNINSQTMQSDKARANNWARNPQGEPTWTTEHGGSVPQWTATDDPPF
jgi:single-strand DNA-binding protein